MSIWRAWSSACSVVAVVYVLSVRLPSTGGGCRRRGSNIPLVHPPDAVVLQSKATQLLRLKLELPEHS